MSNIAIKEPNQDEFVRKMSDRQRAVQTQTLAELATRLNMFYHGLDSNARRAFVDNAVRMYNNYENRWMGEVSNGVWKEIEQQGSNNTFLTIPLLTAHVDTHTTFYTKVDPTYVGVPFREKNSLDRRLTEMCMEIANKELKRMLTRPILQREAQYLALATVSYRNIVLDYDRSCPTVYKDKQVPLDQVVYKYQCQDCQAEMESPQEDSAEGGEAAEMAQCQDENCMGTATLQGQETRQTTQTVKEPVVLPRPVIKVPNPILVQDDFSAGCFSEGRFVVTRNKISKREAEFYYQVDLSSTYDSSGREAEAQYQGERRPVGPRSDGGGLPLQFPSYENYNDYLNQQVEEVKMWLEPCEYAMHFADGEMMMSKYPFGLHLHVVGDQLVKKRPALKDLEWIRVQSGVRPMSNKGMGMQHLADLNDVVNNAISLEYSILRTHGFPIRLLRGKWLSSLPQALQTLVMEKIPDDQPLQNAIHTEQASNTTGLLGVFTGNVQSHMQVIGGMISPMAMPQDMKDALGNATGASSVQEAMADKMGLSVQWRVEGDIDTIFAVLELLRRDDRNKQWMLDSGYDESLVDSYFRTDFRSLFYVVPAKGSDQPRLDSVNTFKVQSFAQLTAALTGLRQFDPNTFYDIIGALGETLNLDVSIGAGRKERNLATNRINQIVELYKEQKDLPDQLEMQPTQFGQQLFQAVTLKEKLWLQQVLQSQIPQVDPSLPEEQQAQLLMQFQQLTMRIEAFLYDYDALVDSYSDWLQSEVGQNADIPVQLAVGMLYAHSCNMQEKKRQLMQMQAIQQAMASMSGDVADETASENEREQKSKVKRDGSSGPGRPMDPHVDKQVED